MVNLSGLGEGIFPEDGDKAIQVGFDLIDSV